MADPNSVLSQFAWVPWNEVVTCISNKRVASRGIWLHENPLTYSAPSLMLQIILSSLFTGVFDFLLRPLGLCSFFSQMLGAIVLGPASLGKSRVMDEWVFSKKSLYVFESLQTIGSIFFFFLVGLKMDARVAAKSGHKVWIIGISLFLVPVIISVPLAKILAICLTTDERLGLMLPIVGLQESHASFHVIICLLGDLKLLNSEIGRLAMNASMISSGCSWFLILLISSLTHNSVLYKFGTSVGIVLFIVYVMRPIMLWMIKDTAEGNSLKEAHVLLVFFMMLFSAFLSQMVGSPVVFGPVILGLAVPPGPPLATTLEAKLESIVSLILMPIYYVASAGRATTSTVTSTGFALVTVVVIVSLIGKFIGTLVPSIYCNMPFQDALSLSVIMCSQGTMNIQLYRRSLVTDIFSPEVYCVVMYWAVVIAGITSPLVKYMYKPSSRYADYRRTLQHNKNDSEFRILACAYRDSDATSLVNLLEASHPSMESPICVYLLHVVELPNIGATHLVALDKHDTSSFHYNLSKRIIHVFQDVEKQKKGVFSVYSFTCMSPYTSMHDDICSLAGDKRTTLIILPFHRQLNRDGIYESITGIRNVNRNVLKRAPCTVGILLNRGSTLGSSSIPGPKKKYRIGMFFLGGADDREVVIYGMRMGEKSNTALTLIRFRLAEDPDSVATNEHMLDAEIVKEFRSKFEGNHRVVYVEEEVTDGVEIIKRLKSVENFYDLMIVGRQHSKNSLLLHGLDEWIEFPELGFMGDFLATSISQTNDVSILVLQQQFWFSQDSLSNSKRGLLDFRL